MLEKDCPAPETLVPGELAIDETAPDKGCLTAPLNQNATKKKGMLKRKLLAHFTE